MSGVVGGGIIGGALGGGLAVTVLAPLTAANNFLGSYFFGSGMILGERQMYQDDWIKIKKRLDAGESFLVILEEVMKPNTQAVMQMARQTVIAVSKEWNDIVLSYLQSIPQSIWDAINKINAGEELDNPWPLGEGIIGIINGVVQCHTDYHRVGNTCVSNNQNVTSPVDPTLPTSPPSVPTPPLSGNTPPVPWNSIAGNVPIASATLSTYIQLLNALHKANNNRLVLLASKRTYDIENRKSLLASINKIRIAVIKGINSMNAQYKNIATHPRILKHITTFK